MSEEMNNLEWNQATRDAAIQLWRASMLCVTEAIPDLPRQIADPHRRSIRQLLDDTPTLAQPEQIEVNRAKTAEILRSYGSQMSIYMDAQEKEFRSISNSVAHLADALSALDQRYLVKMQGIIKKLRLLSESDELTNVVNQMENALQDQQREVRSAIRKLDEDIAKSEVRKQKSLPGPGSEHASDSLIALERAVFGWDSYCLVRYEFQAKPGIAILPNDWEEKVSALTDALPECVGHKIHSVIPRTGIILSAVGCQMLEYTSQAESMEKSLTQLSGAICTSRLVEPRRDEAMREAMARLEKAG